MSALRKLWRLSFVAFVALAAVLALLGSGLACSGDEATSDLPGAVPPGEVSPGAVPPSTLGDLDLGADMDTGAAAPADPTADPAGPSTSPTPATPPDASAPADAPTSPDTPAFPDAPRLSLGAQYHFDSPAMAMAVHPRYPDWLYFALRDGRVVALAKDSETAASEASPIAEILDMSAEVSTLSELGLTGLTFSPDGNWLLTMSHGPDLANRHDSRFVTQVYAWQLSDDGTAGTASPDQRRLILELAQPFGNHNGGDLTFGPDQKLYVALGDGGGARDPLGSGQDITTLLGSILRIEPNLAPISQSGSLSGSQSGYTIPSDNPFAGGEASGGAASGGAAPSDASGVAPAPGTPAPEIWLYGVRNPWRISFDTATGDLWIADVGQDMVEEINQLTAASGGGRGANLGWSDYEGSLPHGPAQPPQQSQPTQQLADHTPPTFEYQHQSDRCASVTGGHVYRGAALAGYQGVYIYGDFCYSTIFGLLPGVANRQVTSLPQGTVPVSFGRDLTGELYVLTQTGWLYQLRPPASQ